MRNARKCAREQSRSAVIVGEIHEFLSFSHANVTLTRKNVKIDTSSTTSHGKDKKPRRKMNGG